MREIKFKAWDEQRKVMHHDFQCIKSGDCQSEQSDWIIPLEPISNPEWIKRLHDHVMSSLHFRAQFHLMQFTGLLDKNGVAEIYEGDIINPEGKIKGNIYESPQIYEKGIDCLVEGMGTKEWRNAESVAVGFGCKYAK